MTVESPRSAERLTPFTSLYGLQGRIAAYDPTLRGTPQDVLNINNHTVEITVDKLEKNVNALHGVLSHASEQESNKYWKGQEYEVAMNKWKKSFVNGVVERQKYFSEQSHAEYFKQLGLDVNSENPSANVDKLYTTYIDSPENPKERTLTFVSSVLKTLERPNNGGYDLEKFMKEREGIQFMAGMYGKDGAAVIMQMINSSIEIANDSNGFVHRAQTAVNTIPHNSQEEHLVVYLLDAQSELQANAPKAKDQPIQPAQKPAVDPKKDVVHPPKPLPNETKKGKEIQNKNLTKRFAEIKAEPELANNPYRVDVVPTQPLDKDLKQYEFPHTFFVNNGLNPKGTGPSRETAPHAYTLDNDEPGGYRNARYLAAEEATNGDSGLFGVSAASAKTPEEQARLFSYLSQSILNIHKINPSLLGEWIKQQSNEPEDGITRSSNLFIQFDLIKSFDRATGAIVERTDGNEKLFALDGATANLDENLGNMDKITINTEKTVALWQTRIPELQKALDEDSLKDYHLRWMELLGHAVRIPKLIEKAQGK